SFHTVPAYFSILLLLVLAWGAFAFGAVYDWAYRPLLWACAGAGLLALVAPGANGRRAINWPLAAAIALLLAAVGVQLLPLAPAAIARVSPGSDALLCKHDVVYALATHAPEVPYRHPLSIDPPGTWLGLACLAAFGALLLGTARAMGRRSLQTLAAGLAIVGLLLALTGIVQSGLGVRDRQASGLIYGFWKPIWGTNPFGPFVNRNHFAGWMLMALPVVLGYFVALVARGMRGVKPTLRHRVLWFSSPEASRVILVGLAAAVMAVSLVLTFSRSGILGFILALAVSAGFVLRGLRTRNAGRVTGARRTVAIGYIVLLAVLAIGWAGIGAVADRFAAAEGTRLNGRLPIWEDTAPILRDFPLTGTGLNTYATAMLYYQVWEPETLTAEAHNDYLQLAAEGGLLVGVPALVFAFVLAWQIRRRFQDEANAPGDALTYWLRVGATTGLLAIGLQETVEFSLQMPGNAALFAVLAGIALHRANVAG
ncbi:MAG: O-antigen ligase domain-containing protein, partial [Acidobacteria bacterium]